MHWKHILKEVLSLLYWSMLAACTIGPGTVVTCARAGAEYQLHLIWALIFASILAYILQEGTARLTIVSGKSLGECLQLKYSHGRKLWHVGIFCWIIVACVFIGNTLYECNNFAGGMAAIYALPPAENTTLVRVSCCIGYAIIVIAILLANQVNYLGVGLGIVTVSMVVLFFALVVRLGVDATRFAKGLFPIYMPAGSANVVLSLVGTTSIGFNLFLGGEMARGKRLDGAQRGIAFSTFMALLISVLILIVGDGTYKENKGKFTIESLARIIIRLSGDIGIWVFGIGFIAAALSSMLTVPLGAALTAESIFTINGTTEEKDITPSDNVEDITPSDNVEYSKQRVVSGMDVSSTDDDENEEIKHFRLASSTTTRPFPKKYANSMMVVMVLISMCVVVSNAPTVLIILIAQVLNGCLLPMFSICLLICINENQFMSNSPQKGWSNCCLVLVVLITLFLTSTTIIQNVFGWTIKKHYTTVSTFQLYNFLVSAICSIIIMVLLLWLTDLGNNIRKSFSIFFRRHDIVNVS